MKTCLLITLVKERPLLYDIRNPLNKDQAERNKMWNEISTTMKLHCDIVKSRWKSLKDCYTKYLKSTITTEPPTYTKYMHWQWAEHMEFLKPNLKIASKLTNLSQPDDKKSEDLASQSNSDIQGYQSGSEILETHEISDMNERSGINENSASESLDVSTKHERPESHERSETQRRSGTHKRLRTHHVFYEKVKKRRRTSIVSEDINNSPSTNKYFGNNIKDNYSATELVFLGYAKSIKTFSVRRQAQIKLKIAKIMMEEEIAHYEETTLENEYQ